MAEDVRKVFARNLVGYLELNKYKQADLARHMNVSTATVAKWCTGQTIPRMDKIQSICNWLGVDKSDLLDEKSQRSEKKQPQITAFDSQLLTAYHSASEERQSMILDLLHLKGEPSHEIKIS